MAKIPVQIVADPAAAHWLTLSAVDGADGLSLNLDPEQPIDVQLSAIVAERQQLRTSFGVAPGSAADHDHHHHQQQHQKHQQLLPPPATLGVLLFRKGELAQKTLKKLDLKAPVPPPRSLGLDSMLMFSDTLLPGVDSTACTASSTQDLVAFVNASGSEASPWQIVHAGCTLSELASVAGHAAPTSPREMEKQQAAAVKKADEDAAAAAGAGDADGDGPSSKKEQEQESESPDTARSQQQPPPTPGRMTLVIVGDLLEKCSKDIFQMVATMARPFRPVAPRIFDGTLAAYAAQDSVMVGTALRVSRDGCAVWRPAAANGVRRLSSIHTASNAAAESALPTPEWNNGSAVFVNHPIGPAQITTGGGEAEDGVAVCGQSGLGDHKTAYRRVLRITWTDAFLGAEHGGPEARRRFSAPAVAIGLIHSSQAREALKLTENPAAGGHVFGNLRDSVMWCLSPDAALFPGPHLQPIRGPALQTQPHIYVPNPIADQQQKIAEQQQQLSQSRLRSTSQVHNNSVSGKGQLLDESANSIGGGSFFGGSTAPPKINPTVIHTTITLMCDPEMHCVTIVNNGRRVASWDLAEIWAVNRRSSGGKDGDNDPQQQNETEDEIVEYASQEEADAASRKSALESMFYPVVDVGFPGTIVEMVA